MCKLTFLFSLLFLFVEFSCFKHFSKLSFYYRNSAFLQSCINQLQEAENKYAKIYQAIQFKLVEIPYFRGFLQSR